MGSDLQRTLGIQRATVLESPICCDNQGACGRTDTSGVNDVLYTGRSIRSALTAIQSFGRPREIELLTLIDRRFSRHLPIQPDYRGRQVDVINNEKVKVHWMENENEDSVYLIEK